MDQVTAGQLDSALAWLAEAHGEITQAISADRTVRFYTLLLSRGSETGKPVAKVIDLSGGMVLVSWIPPIAGISVYTSIQVAQHALCVGGQYRLEYDDVSERMAPLLSRRGRNDELSMGEKRILRGLGEGLSNIEMADTFGFALSTVKNRITSISQKLGVKGRLQLGLRARHLNLSTTSEYAENNAPADGSGDEDESD